MRLALILITALLLPTFAMAQTTWYVPDDFPAGIQAAISDSTVVNGDTVIVRPGTYVENIDFVGKAITVRSEQGAAITTIDGNQSGSVVTFKSGEGIDSSLEGFTLRNGNGAPATDEGGGISCWDSSPRIFNNFIINNTAENDGGGLMITGHNSSSSPLIVNNFISDNFSSDNGGGIRCETASPIIANNIVINNSSAGQIGGGGFCLVGAGSYPLLVNNTICNNTTNGNGGGIYLDGTYPTVMNNIIWDNAASSGPEIYVHSGFPTVSFCDVKGGWPGIGNIDDDPLFIDPVNRDYHLSFPSPCRNHISPVSAITDFEGDPRESDFIDMGADEFHPHLYHMGDVIPGSPIDIKIVGGPGFPVMLALGDSVLDPPIPTAHGDLYLPLPLKASWNLGNAPGTGVLNFPATVPLYWQSGEEYPFQALVGPWGGPYTRITNLMVLTVE